MKKVIRLKESDLVKIIKRVISEQPDSKFIGQIEKSGYVQGKPETVGTSLKKQEEYLKSIDPDITVDMLSAALDTLPGFGTLVSAGVDVIHSISYFARMIKSMDLEYKTENALMGIITLVTISSYTVGNLTNIIARDMIKKVLKRPPSEIAQLIGLGVTSILQVSHWKLCLITLLLKFLKEDAVPKLIEVRDSINNSGLDVNSKITDLLDELIGIINKCNPNYSKIDKI